MKKNILLLMLAFISQASSAPWHEQGHKNNLTDTVAPQATPQISYQRPKPFHFITNIPGDYKAYFVKTFRKNQLKNFGIIAASTAILMVSDQYLLDKSQDLGRFIKLNGSSNQTSLIDIHFSIGSVQLPLQFNVPSDLNSGMYYLGDGWTHLSIALAYWTFGLISKNNRALQTASQLGECILTTGIATQFIKHITGRESPFTTDVKGGVWRFFPNQKTYATHVPNHDAFPSGHLATAMATVTVIAENYPEKKFIRPIGYSLMALLAYAMLNNGVHWISDYPLSIALGYSFAEIAVHRGRTESNFEMHSAGNTGCSWKLSPSFAPLIPGFGFCPAVGIKCALVKRAITQGSGNYLK